MKDANGIPNDVQDPRTLISLHTDVLFQILFHVDNMDIPAAMLSCKTLCSVIMSRHFWYHRIHRLCKEHLVSLPEEELEEYTVAELKQWAMQCFRARRYLLTRSKLRHRYLRMESTPDDNMLLIPGGRWLLIFDVNQPVYFIDLDRNYLTRYFLLDPSQLDPRDCKYGNTEKHVWIDHKAPRLSLRFAVSFSDKNDGNCFCWVYICQVNLVGHGANATLMAKLIGTFRCPGEAREPHSGSSTLNARHFVQIQYPPSHGDTKDLRILVRILDYSQALGCFDYPWIESHTLSVDSGRELEMINDDILLVFSRCSVSSFTFNTESPTSIKPLHEFKFSTALLGFSRTCWTPEASLITLTREWSDQFLKLHGLVIPHDSKRHPWTVEVGDMWRDFSSSQLGIFNSLACHCRNRSRVRIAHKWDIISPDSDVLPVGYLQQKIDWLDTVYHFDEDTGRSVHFKDGEMTVVDIF